ncbi:MAG: glycogen/starch/alpha-glucan phosphorylase [Negativicutes bacterium]|jgi:starch phosphorylase
MSKAKVSVEQIKEGIIRHLATTRAKIPHNATTDDYYQALAYAVREIILEHWAQGNERVLKNKTKMVCYLSAEFLIGPQLGNNLVNVDAMDLVRQAVTELGIDFDKLLDAEPEPGLGNGGLGRLAACYIDSCATIGVPAIGYGIRYEFGIFQQKIVDGQQVELADRWLKKGFPWEVVRPEAAVEVGFGGYVEDYNDEHGASRKRWMPEKKLLGVPCDIVAQGYGSKSVSVHRLFKAEASDEFDFSTFNAGDFYGSVHAKIASENISKVLYPNDEQISGKELRLEQQYFFVACALRDVFKILKNFMQAKPESFAEHFAVQLNDTHPSIAVAELMRLLVDEYRLDWDKAWEVTTRALAYTNHTLLPEALEKWPVKMFEKLLPRHLEIIYEINQRFLEIVRARFPEDGERVKRLSIIDEEGQRTVRMAHLAAVGSHAVNGVAELHSELLKQTVMADFYDLWPEKFKNITNGVTPRRFVALANPEMTALINEKIGDDWLVDLYKLKQLEPLAIDKKFQKKWQTAKLKNKKILAALIKERTGIEVDPTALFDVQVKRIHEYKRQLLNIIDVISRYNRIKDGDTEGMTARVVIIGGKAAPGYYIAKLIIRLIISVAKVVNNDPQVGNLLKVVFFPNYSVKNGNFIFPAADLSEQISTAGKEASGTGNMKMSLNGALTIGTLDGANVEIREEVGAENFFLFGMTAAEVEERRQNYNPTNYVYSNPILTRIFAQLADGTFSNGDRDLFRPIIESLMSRDDYMILADFTAYHDCQNYIDKIYANKEKWTEMSILNVARMGKFSSDRAIREYCRDIWGIKPAL